MYTEDKLKLIEELAASLMTIEAISVLADIDEDTFRDELSVKSSPAAIAYRRGKYDTILAIQKQEISLAKVASPAAVENASRYLIEMETSEM